MGNSELRYPFLNLKAADREMAAALKEAAARVIDSGRYIGGPEVEEFEAALAEKVQAKAAVGTGNGLDALRLGLRACIAEGRLKEGDEVMVPANTYIASVLAITDAGLTPLLVDPDEETMVMSGATVERNITPRTRAIMPVHLYGRTAWDARMREIAIERGLTVIEDAAQAIGAMAETEGLFGSRHAGALGHIGAFSFYPTKNVGAIGDGGAATTHDSQLAATIRALANYGSDRRYHNIMEGFNSRLDPIQAAMLKVKLAEEPRLAAERFAIATAYDNNISNPHVRRPLMTRRATDCVWHQYVVRCNRRDELREYLRQHGVGTDIHYAVPPHLQPCYAALSHGPLPLTERMADEVVSLPVTPGSTTVADAVEISRIINSFRP